MIELDFGNMMSETMGESGLGERQVDDLRAATSKAHAEIVSRSRPELAFMDLTEQDTVNVKKIAREVRDSFSNFLLLGIGGSALGPKTILEALSPMHNLKHSPRVFILDNVDPVTLSNVLGIADLDDTAVNVITKSGTTAETMSSFMVLYDRIKDKAAHVIATTDPEKGYLRKIAEDDGLKTLSVPPGVGGRYSVLSPVGLLLAEVIGADSDALLRGAATMRQRCEEPELWKNPAYLYGALLYLMDTSEGRNITVMVPYSDRLRALAEWFCQLWSESLGKNGRGSTPYPSIGTTDQHSQMQLWMEGPADKVVTFINIDEHGADVEIPRIFGDSGVAYLGGHSIGELLGAEMEATELALSNADRPNMTLRIPRLDAEHLGQLLYFMEMATAFTGFLYGVNPFDQPSVEESKKFTYGMMGREGFEDKRQEVERARNRDNCFKL